MKTLDLIGLLQMNVDLMFTSSVILVSYACTLLPDAMKLGVVKRKRKNHAVRFHKKKVGKQIPRAHIEMRST